MSELEKKSRGWCFTLNNYTDQEIETLRDQKKIGYRYIIFGKEIAPTTGTPHLQGYLYYENPVKGKLIKEYFPRISLRKQRAKKNEKAYGYCWKEGEFYEIGDRPSQGKITWKQMEEVMDNPQDNIHLFNQYRTSYQLAKGFTKQKNNTQYYKLVARRKYFDSCSQPVDWLYETKWEGLTPDNTVVVTKIDDLQMYHQKFINIIVLDVEEEFVNNYAVTTAFNLFPITKKPYYKYGYMQVPILCEKLIVVSVLDKWSTLEYAKKLSNYKDIISPTRHGARKIQRYYEKKAFQIQEEGEESGQEN